MKKHVTLYGIPGWAIFLFPQIAIPLLLLFFLVTVFVVRALLILNRLDVQWEKLFKYSLPTPFVLWFSIFTGTAIAMEILNSDELFAPIGLALLLVFSLNYILAKKYFNLAGLSAWSFSALLAVLITVLGFLAYYAFFSLLA